MSFEKYQTSTDIKELRQTIEEITSIMGPQYDLQTAMIAYHDPESLETLCYETQDVSCARIDALYESKNNDIDFITDKETRGFVPEVNQRKTIYEVYKLYALFDEQFASDEDVTIHDMQRSLIAKIYDDEIADHQFFADNARAMLNKRDHYAKPLRWITSLVFAASFGISGYVAAHTLVSESSNPQKNDIGIDAGMALGSTAIGWHFSRGIKETKSYKKASNGFARLVAKRKTQKALTELANR